MVEQQIGKTSIQETVLGYVREERNPLIWADRYIQHINSSVSTSSLSPGLQDRFTEIFWSCMEMVIRQRIVADRDLACLWADHVLEPQQYCQQDQSIPQPINYLREGFETLFLKCLENPHEQVDNQPDTTVTLAETPTRDNGNKSRHQQNLAHLSPLDRKRYQSQRAERRFSRGIT